MLQYLVAASVILLILWYNVNLFQKCNKALDKYKGPKSLPIIGNVLDFGTNCTDVLNNQIKLINKYGPIVKYRIGSNVCLLVSDPEFIKQSFANPNVQIEISPIYDFLKVWLGEGIVTSKGNYWKECRKMLHPLFNSTTIKNIALTINRHGMILHNKLCEKLGDNSIDLQPLIKLCSFDMIFEFVMGTSFDAQISSNSDYIKLVDENVNLILRRHFRITGHINFLYKFTSDYKALINNVTKAKHFIQKIIKVNKTNTKCKGNESKALLQSLLDLKASKSTFSEQEIEIQVQTFIFAGYKTMASAISFCLFELAKHPDIQTRLINESNNILGENKNAYIDYDTVNKFEYLKCVIKECQRIYTTVPFHERVLLEDVVIDGVQVPKGTLIQPFFYMLHRNEKHFPNADRFDPERFTKENMDKRHPFAFLPYSTGARRCIGYKYADTTLRIIVLGVVRKFKVMQVENFVPILSNPGVLLSENGLHVQLKLR